MLAAPQDYPLLNLFWTMLWIFVWVLWIFLLVRIIGDIFRSRDLSGGRKVLWLVLILVLPYLGVFIYLIARGTSMHEREVAQAQAGQDAFRDYVRQTAAPVTADELSKLAALKDQGVINDAEFAQQKARILA